MKKLVNEITNEVSYGDYKQLNRGNLCQMDL